MKEKTYLMEEPHFFVYPWGLDVIEYESWNELQKKKSQRKNHWPSEIKQRVHSH